MLKALLALVRRDLTLAFRHHSELFNPLLFFVAVVSLFPLAITPEKQTLQLLAPGIVWVAALLATLLSLDGMFRADFDDGSLEQMLLSPHPTALLVLTKVLAHWLVTGLPLIILGPLLAAILYIPGEVLPLLFVTLALGTPILSLIGGIGTALTVGLRRGGLLLALLVLPLYIPVLIFGANAVNAAVAGIDVSGQIYLLAALLMLALTLTPIATAAALRVAIQ